MFCCARTRKEKVLGAQKVKETAKIRDMTRYGRDRKVNSESKIYKKARAAKEGAKTVYNWYRK